MNPIKINLKVFKDKLKEELKHNFISTIHSSDYVLLKVMEGFIKGDFEDLKKKYKPVIEKRLRLRSLKDVLEKEIDKASTLEELEEIKKKIENFGGETG